MTDLKLVPQDSQLPGFLHYLYDGIEGYVSAATKETVDEEVIFRRSYYQWPSQEQALTDWILLNGAERDVYIAPAIFSKASGKREFFKATNVVWAEFDGALPSDEQKVAIPEPTLVIQSSGPQNAHWYWKLDTPLTDIDTVEGINRALTYQLGADYSGWDANQVLRPPNTINHKQSLPVVLLSSTADTVSPVHFDVLPAITTQVTTEPDVIPDVADVVMQYAWPVQAANLFKMKDTTGYGSEGKSGALMQLAYFGAEMGMSDAELFAVLRNADDRWGKFKDRTDRNKRLADIIGKAKSKHPGIIDVANDDITIYGLLSFLNTEVEIEWVIPNLLQALGYLLLTGPAGVGKTQYSLRWAINLALGRPFLGHEIVTAQRILFFSLEMGHADLKYFLSTMCKGMSQEDLLLLEQNLLIVPLGEALYLDKPEIQAQFEGILDEFKPTGVFIDSVGSSSSGNVSDESTVKALMDFNDRIRQRYSVFTWFIHHNRKAQGDNKKPNKLADVYGNQYLVNRASTVYCLWPTANDIEVICLKKRLAAMEDPWHISRISGLDFVKKQSVALAGPAKSALLGDLDTPTPMNNSFGAL